MRLPCFKWWLRGIFVQLKFKILPINDRWLRKMENDIWSSGGNTLIRNLMRTSKRGCEREVIKLDGSSVSLFDKLNRDKVA